MSDEILQEVVELLYGGGGGELISKMNPTQSDLATREKHKRGMTAGLSAVGAAAGAAGLGLAAKKTGGAYRAARGAQKLEHMYHAPGARKRAVKAAVGEEPLATGLVPLEVAGLGGELMATKILHGDTKKKGSLVQKDLGDILNNASVPSKRSLTKATIASPKARKKGMEYTKKTSGMLRKLPDKIVTTNEVEKALKTRSRAESVAGHAAVGAGASSLPVSLSRHAGTKKGAAIMGGSALIGAGYGALKPVTHPKKVAKRDTEIDVIWSGDFAKADSDKQQVFGWASVVEVDGTPVVDLQGDYISADEMEKAGYEYVMKSRKGGDMHLRDDWRPVEKSEMIESFIVTEEKRDAMGLPDSVPTGWWVGFQVRDPEVWSKVKSGERTGFSIHGHGKRSP